MPRDPYSVLGVRPESSDDEIKSAYRRLAKQYHPDLHPNDPTAAARMNEINAAYEQIKNGAAQQSGPYTNSYGSPYGTDPQWQQDAWAQYNQYSYRRSYHWGGGNLLIRMILAFLVFRLIGSLLFGALLGSGTYSYSYQSPRDGSSPGYYYYYYYPAAPAAPEDTL